MSGMLSAYAANKLALALLKNTAFTGPATVYMSLHDGIPGTTGAHEITGNGYARVAVSFAAAAGGAVSTNTDTTFTGPTPAAWGTVRYLGYWDADTAGNFLTTLQLNTPIITAIDTDVVIASGNATVTIS